VAKGRNLTVIEKKNVASLLNNGIDVNSLLVTSVVFLPKKGGMKLSLCSKVDKQQFEVLIPK